MAAVPADIVINQEAAEVKMENEETVEQDYHFAKYNTEMPGPQYSREEYDSHLQNTDWTREETDYLVNMAKEYCHRWAVVADRYNFTHDNEEVENGAVHPFHNKPRSLEDLKARYYHIWAKTKELRTPGGIANMNPSEFHQHEILTKYDANHERRRKKLAEGLLARDPELVKEENLLLAELQRINMQHTRLGAERADLRARLEAPQSTAPTAPLQSSAVLNQLFQQLFQAERTRKRGRLSVTTGDALASPVNHSAHPGSTPGSAAIGGSGGAGLGSSHRDSLGAGVMGPGGQRKSSGAAGSKLVSAAPIRSLSPTKETRYGISTPSDQRLSSGVVFRSDRIAKMRQGKSVAQTQKLSAALATLRIPDLIVLPTAQVCETFERLVSRITTLNDMRRVVEKLESEVRVAEAMKNPQEELQQSSSVNSVNDIMSKDNTGDIKIDGQEVGSGNATIDSASISVSSTIPAPISTTSKRDDEPESTEEHGNAQIVKNTRGAAATDITAVDTSAHASTYNQQDQDEQQNTGSKIEATSTPISAADDAISAPDITKAKRLTTTMPTMGTDQASATVASSNVTASPRPGSRSSGRGHKRSASVMSTASSATTGAGTGTKRTRR